MVASAGTSPVSEVAAVTPAILLTPSLSLSLSPFFFVLIGANYLARSPMTPLAGFKVNSSAPE